MEKDIVEFLDHSNRIESVYGKHALDHAQEAWDYLIDKDNITIDRILETHRLLMLPFHEAKDFAGKFRDCNVVVGGRACPNFTIVGDMVTDWTRKHGAVTSEDSIREAHIRFEKIHPFEDGNGRTGRILLNWQRVKAGLPILIIHEGYEQREYYKWFKEE